MNELESEQVAKELARLWRRMPPDEIGYFVGAVDRYRLDDVLRVLDAHKKSSRFAPAVAEILAKLKGRQADDGGGGDGTGAGVRWPTHPEVIRQHMDLPASVSDFEAILRFHRQVWFRYSADADKRAGQVKGDSPAARAARAQHDLQRDGMLRKCKTGCAYELAAHGMPTERAAMYADGVDTPDPWSFQHDYLRAIREERPVASDAPDAVPA